MVGTSCAFGSLESLVLGIAAGAGAAGGGDFTGGRPSNNPRSPHSVSFQGGSLRSCPTRRPCTAATAGLAPAKFS